MFTQEVFFPISKVFPRFREVQLVSDIIDCPCFAGVICGAIRRQRTGDKIGRTVPCKQFRTLNVECRMSAFEWFCVRVIRVRVRVMRVRVCVCVCVVCVCVCVVCVYEVSWADLC